MQSTWPVTGLTSAFRHFGCGEAPCVSADAPPASATSAKTRTIAVRCMVEAASSSRLSPHRKPELWCACLGRAARDRGSEALAVEPLLHAFHLRLLGLLPIGVAIDGARLVEPILDRRLLRLFLRALESGTAAGQRLVATGELRARCALRRRPRACGRFRLFSLRQRRRHYQRERQNGPGDLRHATSLPWVFATFALGRGNSSMEFESPNAARARRSRALAMPSFVSRVDAST